MKHALITTLFVAACGSRQAVTVTEPTTSATSTPTEARGAHPSGLGCERIGAPIVSARATPAPPPPEPGLMTEAGAHAKRLFDSERWTEAAAALGHVARGETGDDEGNKQIASYKRAIALFHSGSLSESYAAFQEMARNRSHVKHRETILWLAKFVLDHPDRVDLADFAEYERDDVERFHNPSQAAIWATLTFALARERMREGAFAEAYDLFQQVPAEHPLGHFVALCRAQVETRLRP